MKKTKCLLFVLGNAMLFLISCQRSLELPIEETQLMNSSENLTMMAINSVGSNIQEFDEKVTGQKESVDRMRVGNPWSDFEPTGYYLLPNTAMSLTVEQLSGSTLPKLLIGSYSRDTLRWDPLSIQLTAGVNNIPADALGGMLWIRFITSGTPSAKVRITFNSGAIRVPVYVKDQTSDWQAQLNTYTNAPDVLLINDHVYIQYARSRAVNTTGDVNYLLQTIDKAVVFGEDYISGFDNSAPEHVKPVHKILMTQTNQRSAWGVASWYRTWFAPGLIDEALTPQTVTNGGWGAWHELGHMRQQQAWRWSTLGEVTVNIYSLAAERALGVNADKLKGSTTTNALNFIASTDPNKDFNNSSVSVWTRLFMFHQLWLAFGDNFFINLHKQTRVEKPTPASDAEKMRYFMLKACTISGRNLTTFFQKWGFKVNASVYTEIANLNLPQPTTEPSTLTDDNVSAILQDGSTYKIQTAINNSSVLDVNSHTPANGTAVTLWSNNTPSSLNQQWLLRKSSDGYHILKSKADTTKVLNVQSAGTANGTPLEVWTFNNSASQKWSIAYTGSGNYQLSPAHASTKNVDVWGGSATNGTILALYTPHTSNNQKFKFLKQ